ncbi:MAG TPA: helix-turn-helix transcriptional regulator [Bryobacteraceae bacterium]|nr:helix-turn-helix transcriptional regulator [Bryobacteraceae bacterium]
MPKGEVLGEFEHLVLLAVLRLGSDAYGMRVRREIAERTGRDVSIGAVYATLERLEQKGLVSSILNDPTPERGGRAKRSFQLTGDGADAVNRAHQDLTSMQEGLAFPFAKGAR